MEEKIDFNSWFGNDFNNTNNNNDTNNTNNHNNNNNNNSNHNSNNNDNNDRIQTKSVEVREQSESLSLEPMISKPKPQNIHEISEYDSNKTYIKYDTFWIAQDDNDRTPQHIRELQLQYFKYKNSKNHNIKWEINSNSICHEDIKWNKKIINNRKKLANIKKHYINSINDENFSIDHGQFQSKVLSNIEIQQIFNKIKIDTDDYILMDKITQRRNILKQYQQTKHEKARKYAGLLYDDGISRINEAIKHINNKIKANCGDIKVAEDGYRKYQRILQNATHEDKKKLQIYEQKKKKYLDDKNNFKIDEFFLKKLLDVYKAYISKINKIDHENKRKLPWNGFKEFRSINDIRNIYNELDKCRKGGNGTIDDDLFGSKPEGINEINKIKRKLCDTIKYRKDLNELYGNKIDFAGFGDIGEKEYKERTDVLFKHGLIKDNLIGSGTYGKVFKTLSLTGQKQIAIKQIELKLKTKNGNTTFYKEGMPLTVVREISALKSLKKDSITKVYDILTSKDNNGKHKWKLSIVMEYLPSDLGKVMSGLKEEWKKSKNYKNLCMNSKDKLNEIPQEPVWFDTANIKSIIHDILNGLLTIEKNGYIHRDLKPQNILLAYDGRVKIADFGLSRQYKKGLELTNGGRVVTRWYRAPEVILGWFKDYLIDTENGYKKTSIPADIATNERYSAYDNKADLWSAGSIFVELIVGEPIFKGHCDADQLYKIMLWCGKCKWTPLIDPKAKDDQKVKLKQKGTNYKKIYNFVDKYDRGNKRGNDNSKLLNYIRKILSKRWSEPNINEFIKMLDGIFKYDPNERKSAENLLSSQFFKNSPKPVPPQKKLEEMLRKNETLHTNQLQDLKKHKQMVKQKQNNSNRNHNNNSNHNSHHSNGNHHRNNNHHSNGNSRRNNPVYNGPYIPNNNNNNNSVYRGPYIPNNNSNSGHRHTRDNHRRYNDKPHYYPSNKRTRY